MLANPARPLTAPARNQVAFCMSSDRPDASFLLSVCFTVLVLHCSRVVFTYLAKCSMNTVQPSQVEHETGCSSRCKVVLSIHMGGDMQVWLGRRHAVEQAGGLAAWHAWLLSAGDRGARLLPPGTHPDSSPLLPPHVSVCSTLPVLFCAKMYAPCPPGMPGCNSSTYCARACCLLVTSIYPSIHPSIQPSIHPDTCNIRWVAGRRTWVNAQLECPLLSASDQQPEAGGLVSLAGAGGLAGRCAGAVTDSMALYWRRPAGEAKCMNAPLLPPEPFR